MADSEHWYAALLGVIQGITEFLPISSSAHLILISSFLDGKTLPITLNIALHVGTFFAVLLFFWRDWLELIRASLLSLKRRSFDTFETRILLPSLIIGSVPAAFFGVFWQDQIEATLHHPAVTLMPLAVVGVLLWYGDAKASQSKQITALTYRDAFFIGVAQALALIPGVSRSGSTILGARLLNYSREDAAKFSFMLGTPAMAGACLLNAPDIVSGLSQPSFYLGCGVATLVGMAAIKFLLDFLKRFGFAVFAIYRCLLAAVLFYFIMA